MWRGSLKVKGRITGETNVNLDKERTIMQGHEVS